MSRGGCLGVVWRVSGGCLVESGGRGLESVWGLSGGWLEVVCDLGQIPQILSGVNGKNGELGRRF